MLVSPTVLSGAVFMYHLVSSGYCAYRLKSRKKDDELVRQDLKNKTNSISRTLNYLETVCDPSSVEYIQEAKREANLFINEVDVSKIKMSTPVLKSRKKHLESADRLVKFDYALIKRVASISVATNSLDDLLRNPQESSDVNFQKEFQALSDYIRKTRIVFSDRQNYVRRIENV